MALQKQRIRNKEERSRAQRKYYLKTKTTRRELRLKQNQNWVEQNPEYHKNYRQNNKGIVNAKTARRRANKLQATPIWLSVLQKKQIRIFYEAAAALTKELGIKFEVDHIIPLQGDEVTGLHVPWNLQVIPMSENRSKGNGIK